MYYAIFIYLLVLIMTLNGCSNAPIDDSPIWNVNNRYAVEFENNCNLTKHSIGMTGCSFKEVVMHNRIVIPKMFDGTLTFESRNCNDFSVTTYKDKDTILYFDEIYSNNYKNNCSYDVMQKVNDIGNWSFDSVLIGKLFIKIIKNNKYFENMRMRIGSNNFTGVAWYQNKYLQLEPELIINTRGTKGTYEVACDNVEIMKGEYTNSLLKIPLKDLPSCDYEIIAVNKDNYLIEYGTLVFERQKKTHDLSTPYTYVKNKKRYFVFTDKNKKGQNVVVGIKVNDKICIEANSCSDSAYQDRFVVRAYTMSGRFFYNIYYKNNNNWGHSDAEPMPGDWED